MPSRRLRAADGGCAQHLVLESLECVIELLQSVGEVAHCVQRLWLPTSWGRTASSDLHRTRARVSSISRAPAVASGWAPPCRALVPRVQRQGEIRLRRPMQSTRSQCAACHTFKRRKC